MQTLEKRISDSIRATTVIRDIGALIEEFCAYGDDRLSERTMPTRRTHLKQFHSFCQSYNVSDVAIVTNQFISIYLGEYSKSHARTTTDTALRVIKVFFEWVSGFKEIVVRVIPGALKSVKIKNDLPKAIDWRVVKKVIDNCDNEQDSIMIAIATETGVRILELVSIKVGDIDGRRILIHGKGSVERIVIMTDALSKRVSSFNKRNNRAREDLLLQNQSCNACGPMNDKTARKRMQRAFLSIAGIRMVPHQLRHTFAIFLLTHGCNLVTIQKLLGHQDINTTRIYLRVTDVYVESDYDKAFSSPTALLT